MPKQPINLTSFIAAEEPAPAKPKAKAEEATKRLSVSVTPSLYKRLRMHALTHDQSHQAILEAALRAYLKP